MKIFYNWIIKLKVRIIEIFIYIHKIFVKILFIYIFYYKLNYLMDVIRKDIKKNETIEFDGNVYEGETINGKFDGYGKVTYLNKDIYEGEWSNDFKNGYGKMIYSNGDVYEGNWVNGEKEGDGIMKYNNGNILVGKWKMDEPIEGIITFKDGETRDFTNITSSKPDELKSVPIKKQKFDDCWAHSVSRNFVRTFQILDIIKSQYIEQFYDLFFTILTQYKDCKTGFDQKALFYLLDYLKENYKSNIFVIKYSAGSCNQEYCDPTMLDNIILTLTPEDKEEFIGDLDYLFEDDRLFIGQYDYIVDESKPNKPSEAIKIMLNYRLQPYVGINLNNYLQKQLYLIPSKNFPSVPISEDYDNKCVEPELMPDEIPDEIPYEMPDEISDEIPDEMPDEVIKTNDAGHALNLRRWNSNGIEFKNSWGIFSSDLGNFSVADLKYLTCKKDGRSNNLVQFISVMFDYKKLNPKFKMRINNKLCKYDKTFDDSLEIS